MADPPTQPPAPREVTALLQQWRAGSPEALDELLPLVYDTLRRIAGAQMRGERPDHTLEPTALVHEAYERLLGSDVDWKDRAHFLAIASRTMRRILVDHARARGRAKRGGDAPVVTLDEALVGEGPTGDEALLVLDEALDALAELDRRKAELIQAHYFGGLTYRELAEAFELSEATVHRELQFARAWLAREMR